MRLSARSPVVWIQGTNALPSGSTRTLACGVKEVRTLEHEPKAATFVRTGRQSIVAQLKPSSRVASISVQLNE